MKLKALLIAGALGCAALAAPAAANASELVVAGNMCLDDTGWSNNPGQLLQVYQCTGGSNQQWDVKAGRKVGQWRRLKTGPLEGWGCGGFSRSEP